MNFSCTNQEACPVILDSKCVIYEGENLLYIGVNTNDNYRTALENINTVIGNLILTGGITELTGDVIAVGPGVATATLATVNSNPGQYGSSTAIPKLTVDGKGRVTAITTEAVFIPSGALSFIGDVTGTGNTGSDTTLTLKTVNSNVYTSNNFLKFAVNGKGLVTSATAVDSSDIITALGYTPYNASNPAGYISTINGIAAGGELAGTYPNPTLVNAAVTAKVLTGVNITGGSITDTDSILTAFGKVQNQINGLIGGSTYQGTWNAATNTPTLTSGVGTKGHYYIVSVPGSTNLDGITDWNLGDWAIFDGTAWQQVDNTDAVVSVNGFTGAVSLTTDNIPEGLTNKYYTDARARLALGITTTGSSGPATYDNITGVFNIPDYSAALSGYVPVGRTLTINGTTYDLSANRSWTVSGLPAGGTAGQILAKIDGTDYNTEWIDNYSTQIKVPVKLGAALTKGTPVYTSSADGTNIVVSAASNTSEATSSKTMGLLETGGALNAQVKVVTYGLLAGLDTSAANAEGDPVWLGPGGTLIYGLVNKPYAPAHLVYIGVVTRKQSNNGEIFINVQNGFEMDELHNVSARNPDNNAILAYNTSTSLWEKNTIGGVLGYTPANDANVVHLTGNESIGGNKTFTSAIVASGEITITNSGITGATGVGYFALSSNSGYSSTAFGYAALSGGNSGNRNTAIGYLALAQNTSGYNNTVIGSSAGYDITTGTSNTIVGRYSGTSNITSNVILADGDGNIRFQWDGSNIKLNGNTVGSNAYTSTAFTPQSRTLTINGVAYDLSADRSWTIAGGVTSFNTRTGAITLTLTDVTGALGYTPYNSTNPSGYITSSGSISGSSGSVSGLTLTSSANGINPDSVTQNQIGYNTSVNLFGQTDGGLYSSAYNSSWIMQIFGDFRTGQIATRGKNNGSWTGWRTQIDASNYTSWTIARGGDDVSGIIHYVSNGNTGGGANYPLQAYSNNSSGAVMSFHRSGAYAVNMGLDSDNVFRIGGWSASANRFQMDMSGNLTMAGDVTAYSDSRVKENVKTIENSLEKILSLRGVSYTRIDSDDKKTKIGVIAQETLPIVPEVVNQDNDGMYNVSYGNFAGLFIEGFKEQQKKIEAQDKVIEELKSIINGFTK